MEKVKLTLDETVPVLKMLADKTRLTVLTLLRHRSCCVCELVAALEMSQPAVSQHLRKLRDARIVNEERRGQWIYYTLNEQAAFFPLIERILNDIPEQEGLMNKVQNTTC